MPTTKEFQACQRRMCVPVLILDDNVVENLETIRVTIRSGNPQPDRISFSSRPTNIQLNDNDSKYFILCVLCIIIQCN